MRAAIIGGGVIGAGWAARFLLNGWDVAVFDPGPEAVWRESLWLVRGFEPWGVQMYLVQTDESRTEPTGG